MITVNETLFSKLVSGGEPCLLTIDGEYGGYVKADSAHQHGDGRLTVNLMTVSAPTPVLEGNVKEEELKPFELFEGVMCYPVASESLGITLSRKKEVEHIDTGFDGLVYVDPEVQEGYPQFLNTKDLSLDQLTFLNDNLGFSDGDRLEPRIDSNSMCVLCFFYETIFVDRDGNKNVPSDLYFNDLFQLSE